MKNLVLMAFWMISASANTPSTREKSPLFLEIGEQRTVKIAGLERYSVSGEAVKYSRLPGRDDLLIKGVRPGIATLTSVVRTNSGSETETKTIRVEPKKNFKSPPGLLQALSRLETVEVIDEGEHFILRGVISNPGDLRTLAYLESRYGEFVMNETELDSVLLRTSQAKLSHLLKDYPTLTLESDEGTLFVHGGVPNAAMLQVVTTRIREIQPATRIEIQILKNSNPTIYFKVFLLEVKKELLSQIGTDWKTPHPGIFQLASPKFLVQNTVDLSIQALSSQGLLRILSSPELVVRAPGQAELFAGGELPIHQVSKFNDSVTWKNFGLTLKLDITEYGGDRVRLNIETEMSHLDSKLSLRDIPAIQSNRMKTQVDATMSKPLFLSGLIQEELRNNVQGLPGLSQLPVLGKLFGSEDYQNDRSELVAILLPYRNGPDHPMARIQSGVPRGYLPLPREEYSEHEKTFLRNSPEFPWNVL